MLGLVKAGRGARTFALSDGLREAFFLHVFHDIFFRQSRPTKHLLMIFSLDDMIF